EHGDVERAINGFHDGGLLGVAALSISWPPRAIRVQKKAARSHRGSRKAGPQPRGPASPSSARRRVPGRTGSRGAVKLGEKLPGPSGASASSSADHDEVEREQRSGGRIRTGSVSAVKVNAIPRAERSGARRQVIESKKHSTRSGVRRTSSLRTLLPRRWQKFP